MPIVRRKWRYSSYNNTIIVCGLINNVFFLVLIQDDLTSAGTNTTNLQESQQENELQLESQESNRKTSYNRSHKKKKKNESQQNEWQQESQQNESQQESQELFR